ncbi:MAG: MoaD/ThiS family protein [Flavipsychrobacter sp.]|nr:MoaD/ThiS family protein [Flavipsychrobacter sp.]
MLTFGIVKEITGSPVVSVTITSQITAGELMQQLISLYPELSKLRSIAIAINGVYANTDAIISPGDELAIIPPVSGG